MAERVALPPRERASLALQREIGRLLAAVWVPITVALMRFGFRWRIVELACVRRRYREVRAESDAPLVVCANHLTMLDSGVIAWALGSPWWYLTSYSSLPWNMPEWRNFGNSPIRRVLVYLMKCVPVVRGSDRQDVAQVLGKVHYLLERGEVVLIFPEGGRARSGRVEVENSAHGVGRLVGELPGCRVLCIYVRGEGQDEMTDIPARGEQFHVKTSLLQPTSAKRGVRRSLDLSQQIVRELAELERQVLQEAA
ncbi:MAG: 1-acyl-sn-glycerol-3-phosphate acyltransferase [Candidatus Binatia bacterium]|nr:1-acyl-sn-glycerol-3-phosphate acyltransferase [Candidatus Binatia bacterium]